MNICLKLEGKKQPTYKKEKNVPEDLQKNLLNGPERAYYSGKFGSILLEELVIDGFIIGHHSFSMKRANDIILQYSNTCVVLQYMLGGNNCILLSKGNETAFTSNSSLLYHAIKGQEFKVQLDIGKQEIFQIQFPFSLFQKLALQGAKYRLEQEIEKSYFSGPVDIHRKIRFIISRVIQYSTESPLSIFYLNHRCLDLLRRFIKDLAAARQLQQWIDQKNPELERMKDEILFNLSDPELLRSMVPAFIKRMNVSIYQFNKISNKVFGMTIVAFIKEKRMEKAMELLKKSDTLIGEIGALVGYEEFSTFSRAFAKHFGNPPSHYRQ